jgi:hypothetical protein
MGSSLARHSGSNTSSPAGTALRMIVFTSIMAVKYQKKKSKVPKKELTFWYPNQFVLSGCGLPIMGSQS